jgi:hypothetical protein
MVEMNLCVADAIIRQNQETIGIVFWMHPNSFDIFWTTIGQNRVPRTYQQESEVTIQANVTSLAEPLILNPLLKSLDWGIMPRKRARAVGSNILQ